MGCWATKVRFHPNFTVQYQPQFPAAWIPFVFVYPYQINGNLATWAQVQSVIDSEGYCDAWCRLMQNDLSGAWLDDPGADIPKTQWFDGELDDPPAADPPPPSVDPTYRDNLKDAANAFIGYLDDPEWINFVAKFRAMSAEEVETTAAYKKAAYILRKLWPLMAGIDNGP